MTGTCGAETKPVRAVLWCPKCWKQHIDEGEWATTRTHHKHLCAGCDYVFQPLAVDSVGIALPGGLADDDQLLVVERRERPSGDWCFRGIFKRGMNVFLDPVKMLVDQDESAMSCDRIVLYERRGDIFLLQHFSAEQPDGVLTLCDRCGFRMKTTKDGRWLCVSCGSAEVSQ